MKIVQPLKSLLLLILSLGFSVANAGLSIKTNPFTYDGEYQEGANIPLLYLKARYLHLPSGASDISYFIQRDHYDTAAKGNLFDNRYNAFAGNPIGNQDPSGKQAGLGTGLAQYILGIAQVGFGVFLPGSTPLKITSVTGGATNLGSGLGVIFNQPGGKSPDSQKREVDVLASVEIIVGDIFMLTQTKEYLSSKIAIGSDIAMQASVLFGLAPRNSEKFNDASALVTTLASGVGLRNGINREANEAEPLQRALEERQRRLTASEYFFHNIYGQPDEIASRESIIAQGIRGRVAGNWSWLRQQLPTMTTQEQIALGLRLNGLRAAVVEAQQRLNVGHAWLRRLDESLWQPF